MNYFYLHNPIALKCHPVEGAEAGTGKISRPGCVWMLMFQRHE